MSFLLDTNIIIYAFDPSDAGKSSIAQRLLDHTVAGNSFSIREVLCEVLNAAHKKRHLNLQEARRIVELLEESTSVIATDRSTTYAASELAERYTLQYFDAVICTVARRHGAAVLFSEDMHDGLRIGSMTIINPFNPANAELVEEILR